MRNTKEKEESYIVSFDKRKELFFFLAMTIGFAFM